MSYYLSWLLKDIEGPFACWEDPNSEHSNPQKILKHDINNTSEIWNGEWEP